MSFPIHFTAPDHSRTYIGETIDIASTGFSVQVKTEHPLPSIILAGILPSRVAGDAILCKARVVWQGGIVNGMGRASYKIISIAQKSQERLDQLIQKSLDELLELLLEFPVFQECDRGDLEVLLGLARTRDVGPDAPLYEAGKEEAAGLYIVLDGHVAVTTARGETIPYTRGSVIGRWCGTEPLANEETARPLTEARYLYIPLVLLPELQRRVPVVASLLFGALGQVPPRLPSPVAPKRQLARLQLPRDLQEIPTLPSVFNAVMDCIESPDATPRDLASILRKDMSLSTKILKTVNSALYSFAREITSVHEAVVLLGMQQTANLAITALLLNTLVNENDRERRPEEFWEHSLGSAYFAQLIGRRLLGSPPAGSATADARGGTATGATATGSASGVSHSPTAWAAPAASFNAPAHASAAPAGSAEAPARDSAAAGAVGRRTGKIGKLDRLFTYAILHDIGLVVLFLKFPDHFSMICDAIARYGDLHLAEIELLEIDHCQLGYRVAKAWRLPEPIPTIIAEHHLPQVWARKLEDRAEALALLKEEPVVTLISLADVLARHAGVGIELDARPPEIPDILLESLGLTTADADAWLEQGPAIRKKVEHFFRGMSG